MKSKKIDFTGQPYAQTNIDNNHPWFTGKTFEVKMVEPERAGHSEDINPAASSDS